uniref:Uncharacterized protein n=1 Tax=Picea sitchensis TaxID=3332 RepID=A0A6B9XQ91_PICSI|nr:hypothetical protein Q903MT_gene4253 [Picea sitchensis]
MDGMKQLCSVNSWPHSALARYASSSLSNYSDPAIYREGREITKSTYIYKFELVCDERLDHRGRRDYL